MSTELTSAFQHFAGGFRIAAGHLKLIFGYGIRHNGTITIVVLEVLAGVTSVWREVHTTRDAAVECAESLCADAQEYIDNCQFPQRPYEDLDLDDFIEHLHMRLNHELH